MIKNNKRKKFILLLTLNLCIISVLFLILCFSKDNSNDKSKTIIINNDTDYKTNVSEVIEKIDIVEKIENEEEWRKYNVRKIKETITNCKSIEGVSENGRYCAYIDEQALSYIDRDELIIFDLEKNYQVQSYNFRKRKEQVDRVYLDNEGKYLYIKISSKELSLEEKIPNKLYYVDLEDENKNMKLLAEEIIGYYKTINNGENIIFNGIKNGKSGILSLDIKTKDMKLIEEDKVIAGISHDNKRILVGKMENYDKNSPLGYADADVTFYVGKLEGDEIKNINFLYKLNSYEEIDMPRYDRTWSIDNKRVSIPIYDNQSEKYLYYIFTLKEF